ncbi:MAG: hypothetical protein K5739_05065 [Lachnospiraceae bacterium]|nr:hypothetical protein [Lachnospiraceae bacterium]
MKDIPGKVQRGIEKVLTFIFGVQVLLLMASVIRNLVASASWQSYDPKQQALAVCLLVPVLFVCARIILREEKSGKGKKARGQKALILAGAAFLILLQVIMLVTLASETGWDSGALVNAALGTEPERSDLYLSRYPNNLLLVFFYKGIFRLFHITGGREAFLAAAAPNLLFIDAAAVLLYMAVKKLWDPGRARLACGIFLLLLGLSPWIAIPYSDLPSMFLVSLSFYGFVTYRQKEKRSLGEGILYTACQVLIAAVGYAIKPTVLILYVAFVIWRILPEDGKQNEADFAKKSEEKTHERDQKEVGEKHEENRGRIRHGLLLACFGGLLLLLLSFGWKSAVAKQNTFHIDESRRYTLTHYLMLSVNDNMGVYSMEDEEISDSAAGVKERQALNLQVAGERLAKKGFFGYLKQQWNRFCQIHSEGNFCFTGEGGINFMNFDLSKYSRIRRYFYLTGDRYTIYKHLMQGIWFFVLASICLLLPAFFTGRKKGPELQGKEQDGYSFCMLPILGIILFNLLFESRSRYLMTYLPFYCMAAAAGLQRCRMRMASGRGQSIEE